jgi:signal transduction histidine kinase
MSPLLLGVVSVQDLPVVLGNQFFLVGTIVIVIAAQRHKYNLEAREFFANAALQRTKSSLEQAYGRLQEHDRLKTEFFSNITHELRTPLTTILAPVESLLAGEMGGLSEHQKQYLLPVRRSAMKLLKLINDLLDLAKLEENFMRLRMETANLAGVLGGVVEHARPLAARKGIDLSLEIRSDHHVLEVDVEKIERVVVNLVSNAIKFTESGGQVRAWLDSGSGEVRIGVTDTGPGISKDQHEWIFERFRQADGSVTRRHGGTGIGLALVKELTELHGGRITVSSDLAKGSEFVVHLPAARKQLPKDRLDRRKAVESTDDLRRSDDREPREWTQRLLESKEYRFLDVQEAGERRIVERAPDSGKATRILVVDDNVEVLRFISTQLQEHHAVYVACDGEKGLELARRELPDVVVTDFMMPKMDGVNFVRSLRSDSRTKSIPVIMLTAKTQVQDRVDARDAGVEVYLTKPFSPRELRAAVTQLLEQRGREVSVVVQEQVRSLELISAGLAHEIHNPLNYIRTALFVIQEAFSQILEAADDPAQRTDLANVAHRWREKIHRMNDVALKGINRINRIVGLVREYAREGYSHERSSICLDTTLKDMAPLFCPMSDKDVEQQLDLQSGGALVSCVPEELHRAIGSLWQNALDAVGPAGRVALRTRVEGESLLLEVIDNGPGIAHDLIGKIFIPFFTTKPPGQGLGLGLAIAHRVIHQAGGSLTVESLEDRGTTFRVRLPVVRPKDTTSPPGASIRTTATSD